MQTRAWTTPSPSQDNTLVAHCWSSTANTKTATLNRLCRLSLAYQRAPCHLHTPTGIVGEHECECAQYRPALDGEAGSPMRRRCRKALMSCAQTWFGRCQAVSGAHVT
ncbi:hypothetical protein ACJBU6_01225 [Exserohilum turcicum]